MNTLVFDTETSGLPASHKAAVDDTRNWPRLVELAWVVIDDSLSATESSTFIIKPEGFSISEEAQRIHGITMELATKDGAPLRYAMACLAEDLSNCSTIVAHNLDFDLPVVNCEFVRLRMPSSLTTKSRLCTMKSTALLCNIPGPCGPKWPRLEELYYFLFNKRLEGSHRALNDVMATAECYTELKRRGIA